MSATVSYKGSVLTTVTNQTKKMLTAGKYMEDDVTITDVSVGCDPITQDQDGFLVLDEFCDNIGEVYQDEDGFIVFGSGSQECNWSWMGENAELVKDYGTTKVFLKDSEYANWTPTTTDTILKSSENLETYYWDLENYDYLFICKFHSHFEYLPGSSGKAEITDLYQIYLLQGYGYAGNLQSVTQNINNSSYVFSTPAHTGTEYRNTSGSLAYGIGSHGVYCMAGGSMSSFVSFIGKSPEIFVKCNATYFSTESASYVDQDASFYEYSIKMYRVTSRTTLTGGSRDIIRQMWLNGGLIE